MPPAPTLQTADVVLVIDDEPQIRRVVRNALAELPYRVAEAATGAAGLDIAAAERPALIILDLGLPDRDGADICRDLRTFTTAPIIVLSARHSDREKEKLLDAGADDYVTKPFSTVELAARIRAQLRRAATRSSGGSKESVLTIGQITVDLAGRTVKSSSGDIHLTPTEWNLSARVHRACRPDAHALTTLSRPCGAAMRSATRSSICACTSDSFVEKSKSIPYGPD